MPRKSGKKTGGQLIHETKGAPGSNYILFSLKENQTILSSPGSLIYLQGSIEKGTIKTGSLFQAFARSFGGEDFFITSYKGLKGGGKIAFGSYIPGDILKIDLKVGEEYTISRSSFMCGTENIEISSRIIARGFFGFGTEEGFVMPTIKAINGDASFWLSNYGTFEKITLQPNETIIIDNGIFLASPSHMNYTLEQLGNSVISSIFGGEGLGMKFTGPGEIYIQSKNFNDLCSLISKYVSAGTTTNNVAVNNVTDKAIEGFEGFDGIGDFEGGRKKRQMKKKVHYKEKNKK